MHARFRFRFFMSLTRPAGDGDDLPCIDISVSKRCTDTHKGRRIKETGAQRTINPPPVRARQKRHHPRHIHRLRAPTQRAIRRHRVLDPLFPPPLVRPGDVLPRHVGEHVALDAARRDRVDRDAPVAEILGERFRDPVDGALGRVVQRVVPHPDQPGRDRGHEYQPPARHEVPVRVLRDEELRAEVEAEDEVEARFCDGVERVEGFHARVRDDDVEVVEVREGGFE